MLCRAMGVRWNENGMQLSCFTILILNLGVHGCTSPNSEGLALLQFREKVKFDPFGVLVDWNPNDCDPCMWLGVDCVDGKVQIINLSGLNLEGTLAPELGNLVHLTFFDISKNQLSGTVPPQFGKLTSLEVLDLSNNNLSGTVPADLGDLHFLKRLLLCNNKFEKDIPEEIRKLGLLTNLKFDEVLTATAAEIDRVNRKFGRGLKPRVETSHGHADNSCINLIDSPRQGFTRSISGYVNNGRRVLVEQPSSNLQAFPPNVSPPQSEPILPSRSSGSFSAIPGQILSPIPSGPVASPPIEMHNPNTFPNTGSSSDTTDKKSGSLLQLIIGILVGIFLLVLAVVLFFVFRSRAAKTIRPWKTGLSGQLQKAFVTGVPKLNRDELEAACEDFSNIVSVSDGIAIIYKGTLSSGVEIAVVSTAINSMKYWSKRAELAFRKKIDSLSRVNHKNFVNLIGYCEENEPFTRMMVFEYAPNGTLSEHLHVEELEHLDWSSRMRIIMGTAYCLQNMHELNPSVPHYNLTSKEIFLTDDYAAKIADVSFWALLIDKSKQTAETESHHSELPPMADVETNIYSFGVMLLEIISAKHTFSEEEGHLMTWAAQYLYDKNSTNYLIDPSLKSFKDNELDIVCEVIRDCTQQDARKRPTMKEVIQKLRQELDISPEAATPRLSPLWWAELEILSQEAA